MSALLESITDDEKNNFNQLKNKASTLCQPEVIRKRAEYKKQAVAQLVASGVDEEVAEKAVEHRLEHTLLPEEILTFDNLGQVTVKEVLDDLDKFDGQSLLDPLEPERGKGKAKFYANKTTSNPIVHSFIHGGVSYKLIGSVYQLFSMEHASGMIKGKFRIARKENNKLTFVSKTDLISHYAGVSPDGS